MKPQEFRNIGLRPVRPARISTSPLRMQRSGTPLGTRIKNLCSDTVHRMRTLEFD